MQSTEKANKFWLLFEFQAFVWQFMSIQKVTIESTIKIYHSEQYIFYLVYSKLEIKLIRRPNLDGLK